MSQLISKKSGAPIGVLLGGTGRAPAPTRRAVVVPMLLKPWPGAEPDSTTRESTAHLATPHHKCPMRPATAVHPDRCPKRIAREMPKACPQSHGFPRGWPGMTPA